MFAGTKATPVAAVNCDRGAIRRSFGDRSCHPRRGFSCADTNLLVASDLTMLPHDLNSHWESSCLIIHNRGKPCAESSKSQSGFSNPKMGLRRSNTPSCWHSSSSFVWSRLRPSERRLPRRSATSLPRLAVPARLVKWDVGTTSSPAGQIYAGGVFSCAGSGLAVFPFTELIRHHHPTAPRRSFSVSRWI
jgi:hypothetical protein